MRSINILVLAAALVACAHGASAQSVIDRVRGELVAYHKCNADAAEQVALEQGDPSTLAVAARARCLKEEAALQRAILAYSNPASARSLADHIRKGMLESNISAIVRHRSAKRSITECGQREDIELAIRACGQLIQKWAKNAYVRTDRGMAYLRKGDNDRAIEDFTRAIEIDSRHAPAYLGRGNARQSKNEIDLAIDDFGSAIRIEPQKHHGYHFRARAYLSKGDSEDLAISDYSMAIRIAPTDARLHVGRGIGYSEKSDYDLAITDFDQALRLDSKYFDAFLHRGMAFELKGEAEKARADYRAALSLPVSSAESPESRQMATEGLTRLGQRQLEPLDATLAPDALFEKVSPAVFVVLAVKVASGGQASSSSQGSAVAVGANRLLTNCHVVGEQESILIYAGQEKLPARVVSRKQDADLCILAVDVPRKQFAEVRDFNSLRIGERVYSVGAPLGLELTLTEGIVSGKRTHEGRRYIQTTAPISKGSSGGGLFDSQGRLVGITTFLLRDAQNLNFAIPAEDFLVGAR